MRGAEFIHRVYRFDPFDYQRGLPSILICAGTGMALGIMDRCPLLRWWIDFDTMTSDERDRFVAWLQCLDKVTALIAIGGWFSATSPDLLALGTASIRRPPCYVQFWKAGPDPFVALRTATDLDGFVRQINDRLETAAKLPLYASEPLQDGFPGFGAAGVPPDQKKAPQSAPASVPGGNFST